MPATPIRNLLTGSRLNTCCVICHDVAFNSDLNEFLLAHDCDTDENGYGDEIYVVRLDAFGNRLESLKFTSSSQQGNA